MVEAGLQPFKTSQALLAERKASWLDVLATLEGTRPLLVEVQAWLIQPTMLP